MSATSTRSALSSRLYRRNLPLILVSILAIIVLVEYFGAPYAPITSLKNAILLWTATIGSFAILFGYITLVMMHVRRLVERKAESRMIIKSVAFVITLALFIVIGLSDPKLTSGELYRTLYMGIIMMIPIGFAWIYHFWAPFRMFRVRSIETAMMFLVWTVSVLREMTMMVYIVPPLGPIGDWIMTGPNTAAQRAALSAAAIGSIILAARSLIGKEPGVVELEVT